MPDNKTGWSPDGTQIAIPCGDHISIVDITDEIAKLVTLLYIENKPDFNVIDPIWSSDGSYLSFYISNPDDAHDSSAQGPFIAIPKCPNDGTEC